MIVNSDSIIIFDFGDPSDGDIYPPSLYIEDLEISYGKFLIIPPYDNIFISACIENIEEILTNVVVELNGEYKKAIWKRYDGDPYYHWAGVSSESWTPPPIPEPSTYGALFSLGAIGAVLLRQKRKKSHSL